MKCLENITLKTESGIVMFDADTKKILNTLTLIQAVLNNAKYKSREDQRRADKIYNKLEDIDQSKEPIKMELEDAEFEIVYEYAKDYPLFLQGRTFLPFLDQLDEAAK